jgi:uncharacterized damage-inducible protein DinB
MNQELAEVFIRTCRTKLSEDYYPRVARCLNELAPGDIWWRPHETSNSIGNLILHLCGNIRQWIIASLGESSDIRNRPKEFAERTQIPKAELLRHLRDTLREADEVLERFDRARLLEIRIIQQWDVTCFEAVFQVVEHFSQHLGQIIYITKLRTGNDLKFFDL